jgi:hypothetical protein
MKFIALFSFCLLTSCGDLDVFFEKKPTHQRHESFRTTQGTPVYFSHGDHSCDATHAVKDIRDSSGSIKVWMGVNGILSLETVNIPYPISGTGLQTEAIEDTLWGFKRSNETFCHNDHCREPELKIVPGHRLHFCKTGGAYPRDSLENVALASLIGIIKTYEMHHKILTISASFEKITLLIHPEVSGRTIRRLTNEKQLYDSVSISTDNAFWTSMKDTIGKQTFYIAALPSSNTSDSPYLWELPSVMSHEYGHHLFHHHAPSLGSFTKQGIRESSNRIEHIVSALSEAYADLVAYFTYSHSDEFKKWGWLTLNGVYFTREVSKDFYSDGSKKKLEEWYLHHYIYETTNLPSNIHGPDTTDNHDLGALLAHGLFKLFTLDEKSPSKDQLKSAYLQFIEWSHKLENDFSTHTDPSPTRFLEYTLLEALKIAKKNHATETDVNTKLQTAFNTVFPVFEKPLTEIESL